MGSEISQLTIGQWARAQAADSDPTSFVRNEEFNAAIATIEEALEAAVSVMNEDGSITVAVSGNEFTISLHAVTSGNIQAGQGLLGLGENGVYVVLGTGANQAAAGNHTHADATEETDGFMAAADKAKLDGVAAGATNLALSGSGVATTAAHSDHTHTDATEETDGFMAAADKAKLDALPTADEITAGVVSAVAGAFSDTATITHLFTGGLIQFNVTLATSLNASSGALGATGEGEIIIAEAGGLAVSLGSSGTQAAPGNHTHAVATESQPGFMSAADKAKLDALQSPYWLPPVIDTSEMPLNTDPVGAVRLVTSSNTIYVCVSQVGEFAQQWMALATILVMATQAQAIAGSSNVVVMSPWRTMQLIASLALAPLASPALTGNPTAPTQETGDDSTKLATTAFVHSTILASVVVPFVAANGTPEPIDLVDGMIPFLNANGTSNPIPIN